MQWFHLDRLNIHQRRRDKDMATRLSDFRSVTNSIRQCWLAFTSMHKVVIQCIEEDLQDDRALRTPRGCGGLVVRLGQSEGVGKPRR